MICPTISVKGPNYLYLYRPGHRFQGLQEQRVFTMRFQVTQRQAGLALIAIQGLGFLLMFIVQLAEGMHLNTIIALAGAVFNGALFVAYRRGWEYARYGVVLFTTLLVGYSFSQIHIITNQAYVMLLPSLLALVLLEPVWIVGIMVVVIGMMSLRTGNLSIYMNPMTLILFFMIIGGFVLSRMISETAQRVAKTHAQEAQEHARQAEAHAEQATAALAQAEQQAQEMARQNEEQQKLLELVALLETPTIGLAEGVLLVPIVGFLDSRRAQNLISRLLYEVERQRTRLVILDIAGVETVDTQVARALLQATQSVRLLGCDVALTGISPSIAQTLIHLDVDLYSMKTARTPQEVLAMYRKTLTRSPASNKRTS